MSGLLLWIVLSVCTCWFTIWLPCPLNLFLPILAHVHTTVFCPIVPLFPCICWSVVVHKLYHVFLCTVLLLVLGMLILCGLLSRQIVGKVCTCYLSLCSIFSSYIIIIIIKTQSGQPMSLGEFRTEHPRNSSPQRCPYVKTPVHTA